MQDTHLYSAHFYSVPPAHLYNLDSAHNPHIIFYGGLDTELGKVEAENGVDRDENKVKLH